uniref:Retrotransposon gag domain-containing protein n=1 Tax=Dendroctonus ponderosae TaxID=77166 RepID=A0AAR5PC96_DENPD
MSLVVALRGKAAELLQSLTTMDQGNYATLVHALQLRFVNEHKETVFQAQLRMRQQKSGESLQEFEGDIERLTHLAYPSAPESFRKQLAAERFIERVRGDDMRYHLRLVRPRDISEALIRALEFEASSIGPFSTKSKAGFDRQRT